MQRLRSLAVAVLAAVLVPASRVASQQPPPAPRLVVHITVDQLTPAYFERYGGELTGGLARLLREGASYTRAYQDHAITETAPGHSVVLSGRYPRSTGIVTNMMGVPDPQEQLVGGGTKAQGPSSPFRFRGTTLIDWMRFRDERSRALSVSCKDRGAILPLGRAKQDVYWYDGLRRFTTSSYYADTLPDWVQRFNRSEPLQAMRGTAWTLLRDSSQYREADRDSIETWGRDPVFPHVVPATLPSSCTYMYYPRMDEMIARLALAGVEAMQLGAGGAPDLLAISFSPTDAIGHNFGPDSREAHDQFLHFDRTLGFFLDSLFRLRDPSTVIISLTADHGIGSIPEVWARTHRLPVPRFDPRPVLAPVRRALAARGVDSMAVELESGALLVDRAALAAKGIRADSVVRLLARAFRAAPGVDRVYLRGELARRAARGDRIARRWNHMLPADVAAELMVVLAPHALWKNSSVPANHGAPWDYDAWVPLILWGPGIRPGRFHREVGVVDLAPTLARLLGVEPSEPLDGRPLREALAR
ncbi:MAG TPA: alkaline phosphatase family protein [Gemmatimonadaceae bacterium]